MHMLRVVWSIPSWEHLTVPRCVQGHHVASQDRGSLALLAAGAMWLWHGKVLVLGLPITMLKALRACRRDSGAKSAYPHQQEGQLRGLEGQLLRQVAIVILQTGYLGSRKLEACFAE